MHVYNCYILLMNWSFYHYIMTYFVSCYSFWLKVYFVWCKCSLQKRARVISFGFHLLGIYFSIPSLWWTSLKLKCFFFLILFYFFWLHHVAWGILVPWPGIEPLPPALEVRSPNHRTTREVPEVFLLGTIQLGLFFFFIHWVMLYLLNGEVNPFTLK